MRFSANQLIETLLPPFYGAIFRSNFGGDATLCTYNLIFVSAKLVLPLIVSQDDAFRRAVRERTSRPCERHIVKKLGLTIPLYTIIVTVISRACF